ARLSIIDSKVRPVVFDPYCERTSLHRHLLAETLRDVESPRPSRKVNDNAAFVTPAVAGRLGQLNFCSTVSAFHDLGDLLLGRFCKRKNRFFDFHVSGGFCIIQLSSWSDCKRSPKFQR